MITITPKGANVEVSIEGKFPINGTLFTFTFNCGQEYVARMLAHNINMHLDDTITKLRRQAYEQGWSDAKKKQRKKNWFSGVIASQYPFG